MPIIAIRWMACVAIALTAGFVAAPASAAAQQVGAKQPIVVTEQSRSLVSTRVGVPVEIRLQGQSGTGFSWAAIRGRDLVTEKKPVRSSKAMPGSAQAQRFQFVANRAGTYRLTFSYDQPWRGGTKGARTKSFIVAVR